MGKGWVRAAERGKVFEARLVLGKGSRHAGLGSAQNPGAVLSARNTGCMLRETPYCDLAGC